MASLNGYTTETMDGAIYNFFGTILPDFGFPDKQMWNVLREKYPNENWDRGQTFDLYKWYETGINSSVPPFDIDTGNTEIFSWMKDNSPYTDNKVQHWANAFEKGIKENWIEGHYIGIGMAPAHQGSQIVEGVKDLKNLPGKLGEGMDKLMLMGYLIGGLAVLYYGAPALSKILSTKKPRRVTA